MRRLLLSDALGYSTIRVMCLRCRKFFSTSIFEDESAKCPSCGSGNEDLAEVPKWYGGWKGSSVSFRVEWLVDGEEVALIPEFYLNDYIWFEGQKGKKATREDALAFFERKALELGLKKLRVIKDIEFQTRT